MLPLVEELEGPVVDAQLLVADEQRRRRLNCAENSRHRRRDLEDCDGADVDRFVYESRKCFRTYEGASVDSAWAREMRLTELGRKRRCKSTKSKTASVGRFLKDCSILKIAE